MRVSIKGKRRKKQNKTKYRKSAFLKSGRTVWERAGGWKQNHSSEWSGNQVSGILRFKLEVDLTKPPF